MKKTNLVLKMSLASSLIFLLTTNCGGKSEELTASHISDPTTSTELVAATIGGALAASDGSSTMASHDVRKTETFFAKFKSELALVPSAEAQLSTLACPTVVAPSTYCSVTGNTMTLAYNGCNFGNTNTSWEGDMLLQFSSAPTCGTFPSTTTGTLTRTFAPGTSRESATGVVVALDTTNASGYSSQVSGGETVSYDSAAQRTLTINGIHIIGGLESYIVWNETVSSTAITVAISGGTKTITSGTATVQHNLLRYTGTSTISNLAFNTTCCTPISGSISTTFSGSRTDTESLTFNSCGNATLTNTQGTSTVTIQNCF